MEHNISSDEIVQRINELDNGTLQNAFADSTVFCEQLYHSPVIHHLPVGFTFHDDQFVLQKRSRTYADYVGIHTPFSIEKALGMSHFDYKPMAAPHIRGCFFLFTIPSNPIQATI